MLAHLGANVLAPMQTEAAARAALLPPAISAYCTALEAGNVGTTLTDARAAFGVAIDAWESADAVLVGPAAMDNRTLRGLIYSWPLIAPCTIDEDTARRHANATSYDVSTRPLNARSLSAVEYLLYTDTATHACATVPAGWNGLGANLPLARCQLALAIATDVAVKTQQVSDGWVDYATELATAGESGSSITSEQVGVNLISDGMFYVDKLVKDMKLGEAGGIAINSCNAVMEPCLREVELRLSDRSTFAIRNNLAAFKAVFTGIPLAGEAGPGFDDFLIGLGHQDVADRMTTNIDAAIAAATALPDSFMGALSTDYAKVVATHAAVRSITEDLKSQFLTLLALDIPDDVATDND